MGERSNLIECRTLHGGTKLVPRDKLILRPAVYGIIVHEGQLLLVRNRSTGKYYLPGGGLDAGERLEEALRREVIEETGITITVGKCAYFKEHFFYYEPLDEAYHGLLFFYLGTPRSFDLLPDEAVRDDEAINPQWVDLRFLQAEDFNSHGDTILSLLGLGPAPQEHLPDHG